MSLFEQEKMFSSYFMNEDEAYLSALPFDETVELIDWLKEEVKVPIDEKLLVIELKEGVFIRATEFNLCEGLTKLANSGEFGLSVIGIERFEELTRKYKSPLKSFGNEGLARWKIGF